MCPCDGSLSVEAYALIVERLIAGFDSRPGLLLEPLIEKMEQLSREQRFEEAGWVRDRHNALARALIHRWRWRALQETGAFEAKNHNGDHILVDHGFLVSSWAEENNPPLRPADPVISSLQEVAASVLTADEANLVWRWLETDQVELLDMTGALAMPVAPIRVLAARERSS